MCNIYLSIINKIENGLILLNEKLEIELWNKWIDDFSGISSEEVLGKKIYEVSQILNKKIYLEIFNSALKFDLSRFCSGSIHKIFILPKENEEYSDLRQNMEVKSLSFEGKRYVILQISNVTSQHERISKLNQCLLEKSKNEILMKQLVNYDILTNLPNRKLLIEQLNHNINNITYKFSVMFIDLDRFKFVNDTYGHEIGDRLLVNISRIFKEAVEEIDIVSRYGGDEFVVLLNSSKDEASCIKTCEQIREKLSDPINLDEIYLSIKASIGVAFFPDNGSTSDELIRNADRAMYKAKEKTEFNYVFFNDLIG